MISCRRLFVALVALIPLAAFADGGLQWRCWYDQQVHIACLIENLPNDQGPAALPALPQNLPAIVKQMRQDPGAFRNRFIQIPLHSEPYDMEFTAVLAKATVCGSRRDCSVNFTQTQPPASVIAALLDKEFPGHGGNGAAVLAMAEYD